MADGAGPSSGRIPGKLEQLAIDRHARDLELAAQPGGHPKGFWFDEEAADRAVRFIEGYCRHWEGEWSGEPLILSEWQRDHIVRPLFGWKRRDHEDPAQCTRRYRLAAIFIPRKNGKALDVETPIPTPGGWTTMGAIEVGDHVFDEHGRPCVVTATTSAQIGRPCFRVTFSDGTQIVADGEHEWLTEARRTGGRAGGPSMVRRIRTTSEILATLEVGTRASRAEWNHRIPVAGPLKISPATLPIDPYVLGAWLGDGHSSGARVTQGADDFAFMRAQFEAAGYATRAHRDPRNFGVQGLQSPLRALGLLGCKHIPARYLRGSDAQRLALLQGLMDTDGYASKAGQCELTTVSTRLRDDALELLRSLGFKPSCNTHRATIAGRDCGPKHRIQFWSFSDRPVFRMPRKRARLRPPPTGRVRSRFRQIVAVDPVPSVPVRCIQVSSPSSLYLAGAGMVPTHNSTICGALGVLLLVADGEPGAQVYVTATKEAQAAITWNMGAEMVKRSPQLRRFVRPMRKLLWVDRTSSKFAPLGGDSRTLDALNAHGHISDETHAQWDPRVFWVVQTSQAARRQPLTVCISTAGVYDPEAIGWQLYDKACKVLEGTIEDDATFAFVAQADEGDDWFSEATQRKANPGYGISVKPDYLREQAEEARRNPAYLNEYLRLHLNIWTRQLTRWLPIDRWKACGPETDRARAAEIEKALEGRGCFGGLDLSAKLDLSALGLVFPQDDGTIDVLARFWLPEATIEAAARKGQTHYEQWARDGWLTATPGNVIDYRLIRQEVNALASRFKLRELAYDPWGATQIATQLQGDGIVMVECRQGFKDLSEPSKELEALVVGGKLRHTGDPVLRFCVGNAVIARDAAGNIKPDKEKAAERIDGVVATIMGLSRWVRQQAAEPGSYLDAGPMLVLG